MVQFIQLIHNVYIGTMQSSNSMCIQRYMCRLLGIIFCCRNCNYSSRIMQPSVLMDACMVVSVCLLRFAPALMDGLVQNVKKVL